MILFCFTAGTFIPHASPSLQTGVAFASTRQLRSQGPASVQAHRSEGVTGSEGKEGTNGVGGGIGVEGGNGDGNWVGGGNGDVNGHGDGDGAGAGTGTGVEVNEEAQDGDGDGDGDGSEDSCGDGNGDEDNGNGGEDRIGEGGREAKKRKKPHKTCRRHVGNGGDLGVKRKTCRKERVGPVAANPDNLESNKEAGGVQMQFRNVHRLVEYSDQ